MVHLFILDIFFKELSTTKKFLILDLNKAHLMSLTLTEGIIIVLNAVKMLRLTLR